MNTKLLNKEFQDFINTNLKSDITKLILKGSPFKNCSMQEIAEQIIAKNKCEKKLPTWFRTKNIYFPNKLNIEQTSSEITAKYKASLIENANSIVDISGGFGVDSYYFSKKSKHITHCEINEVLSKIVAHNLKQLNVENCTTYIGDGLEFLQNNDSKFDWVYADPSRRNILKRKVFLLKDCEPNIPKNIDFLFTKTSTILLKLAPILDIKSAVNELKFVNEIHIVAVENEVKELLFMLQKDYIKPIKINAINLLKTNHQKFCFEFNSNAKSTFSEPLTYLYEPNTAVLKSGGFNHISQYFNINKIHQHSHLYTSNKLIDFPGRRFKINKITSYNKKEIKKLIPSKKANITTRNFPETVSQIRKKTNLNDGGNDYLFFTTDINNKLITLICSKV